MAGYALPRKTSARGRTPRASKVLSRQNGCWRPPAYNEAVGYLISAAEGEAGVNLTDPQWRALIYVASKHGFSVPHLRLEGEDEALEVDGSDAEGLRSALGKALEVRDIEEISTPEAELDYDTIQRVRHVLRSDGVRLARPRAWKAGE